MVHGFSLFCLFVLLSCIEAKLNNSKVWDTLLDSINSDVKSHLVESGNGGRGFIQDVLNAIHANQHPPKSVKCKSRRLLIMDPNPQSFEGLGSILREICIGVSTV